MPTTFVKGDFLIEAPLVDGTRAFAFSADVSGKMDAGIAVAVRKRWPAIADWWAERGAGKTQAGDAAKWKDGSDVVYALAIEKRGTKPKVSWLDRAVRAMVLDATKSGVSRISVARLWAGPNGLDGKRAKKVLDEIGEDSPVSLVVFEQFLRAKPAESPSAARLATEGEDVLDVATDDEPEAPAASAPKAAGAKSKAKPKPKAKPKATSKTNAGAAARRGTTRTPTSSSASASKSKRR